MDGRPLYEYARKGIPLPRPIEPRKITVHSLEIEEWLGDSHPFRWPTKSLDEVSKKALNVAIGGVGGDVSLDDTLELDSEEIPSAFVLKMTVSGGTYVRSIVHDLAHAMGSAGHVVTLSRTRQGRFALETSAQGEYACIPWDIFAKAVTSPGEPDMEGWTEWEREVISNIEIVD